MSSYHNIAIAGGDTATPLNLAKRIQFIAPFLVQGKTRFIDCGCGAGEYVHELKANYQVDAWGVEYSEAKVKQAKENNPSAEKIQQGNIEHLEFPDNSFDLALLNEVLEHVPDEHRALTEVCRVLKTGGTLILFSPNRWYPFETHGVHLKKSHKPVKPYVPFIPYIPLSMGEHIFSYWARNYWQNELKQLIEANGFEVIQHSFLWQTFENISGNQPWFIQKTKGLLRIIANFLEATPLLRRFGVSQAIVARKAT